MGKYNRDMDCFNVIGKMLYITQKIKENPFYSNTLHAYGKTSRSQDSCIASIHQLEIIGTLVKEGSKEWALYQMMQGEWVCHTKAPSIKYSMPTHYVKRKVREDYADDMSIQVWLSRADDTGWQIYEPKPEPLLANAKVGDLCKTDLDEWIQIDNTSEPPSPILYHFDRPFKGNIIHTEPLAPEGSVEWAVQRMKLGDKVTKRHLSHIYWQYDARPHLKCISEYNCGTLQIMVVPEIWLTTAESTGWQIYKEPEPQYKVGDWVTDGIVTGYIESWGMDMAWVKTQDAEYHINLCNLRKLPHSEVVVDFGFAKGRILSRMSGYVKVLNNKSIVIATIIVSEITNPATRELVESLLKAQQEEK